MAGKPQIPEKHIADALRANGNIIKGAAAQLGCTRGAIRYRIEHSEKLKAVREEISEENLDLAEHGILEQIRRGEFPACKWYLESKGKERGYARSTEVTGKGGGPIRTALAPDLTGLSDDELATLEKACDKIQADPPKQLKP